MWFTPLMEGQDMTEEQIERAVERRILQNLDHWLEREIHGDECREKVRAAMIKLISPDPEYWGSQRWWNVFDHAKCDRLI